MKSQTTTSDCDHDFIQKKSQETDLERCCLCDVESFSPLMTRCCRICERYAHARNSRMCNPRKNDSNQQQKRIDSESSKENIDHVVVLMLENRSFDTMLGFMKHSNKINVKGLAGHDETPQLRGLATYKPWSNSVKVDKEVIDEFNSSPQSWPSISKEDGNDEKSTMLHVQVCKNETDPRQPKENPGEFLYPHTSAQLYYSPQAPPKEGWDHPDGVDWNEPPKMKGFLQDFHDVLKHEKKLKDTKQYLDSLSGYMMGFTHKLLPVLHTLADQYALSDEWFASVPTQTWPNRLFAMFGQSFRIVHNESPSEVLYAALQLLGQERTPFFVSLAQQNGGEVNNSRFDKDKFSWLIYTHATFQNLSARFFLPNEYKQAPNVPDSIPTVNKFYEDAANGTLPNFTMIEPLYAQTKDLGIDGYPDLAPTSHNDHHPQEKPGMHDRPSMFLGEKLILDVYESLFVKAPQHIAERTLLIVTYDEAGGCFDHISPPKAPQPFHGEEASKNKPFGPTTEFRFNRYGIRVPSLFISPRIQKGTILRASYNPQTSGTNTNPNQKHFCHTSIMKSVLERFGKTPKIINDTTGRVRAAPSIWHVLSEKKQQNWRTEAETLLKTLRQDAYILNSDFKDKRLMNVDQLKEENAQDAGSKHFAKLPKMSRGIKKLCPDADINWDSVSDVLDFEAFFSSSGVLGKVQGVKLSTQLIIISMFFVLVLFCCFYLTLMKVNFIEI